MKEIEKSPIGGIDGINIKSFYCKYAKDDPGAGLNQEEQLKLFRDNKIGKGESDEKIKEESAVYDSDKNNVMSYEEFYRLVFLFAPTEVFQDWT